MVLSSVHKGDKRRGDWVMSVSVNKRECPNQNLFVKTYLRLPQETQ